MLVAADNLSASNPAVARALRDLDPEPLKSLARRCQAAGAELLDLNPGYLSKRRRDRMAFLVQAVQEAVSLPLILDSPDPAVLAQGLAACRTKPILNALTLEGPKLAGLLPLAAAHGTDLVLLLIDERSFPPPDLESKIALAVELRQRAVDAGLAPECLIIDPVLPNLSWPDAFPQVREVIKTVHLMGSGEVFGEPVRTMAGLSNLRSGLRRQYPFTLEATVLTFLAAAGLHLVLADVLQPGLMDQVRLIRQISLGV